MNNGLVRNLPDHDKPLCPNATSLAPNSEHALRVRILDAFYEAADRNEDEEMAEPLERAYSAAAYKKTTDRMDLFFHGTGMVDGDRWIVIEAWWYRCHVCGLTLPATSRGILP